MAKVKRDRSGRVTKGSRLNPSGAGGERGGRPRLDFLRALERIEPLAVKVLIEAMQSSKYDSVRFAAARYVIDRLHGLPTQPISGGQEIIHRHYICTFEHPDGDIGLAAAELRGPAPVN